MNNTTTFTINTSPAHNKCLFCKYTTKYEMCNMRVKRPMKSMITALWGCPPWETRELKPDQHYFCKMYERDKNKPGYQYE